MIFCVPSNIIPPEGKMKYIFLVVFMLIGISVFSVEQIDYISDFDGEIVPSSWYFFDSNENDQYYLFNINLDEGNAELLCDIDGNTVWYKKWYTNGNLMFHGIQQDGYVECTYITQEGDRIIENVELDSDFWYQSVGPQLPGFIESEDDYRVFSVIDFENMKSYNMRIERKFAERIDIEGNLYNSIYTELRFTGFLKGFWLGKLWFDSETSSYVKYLGKLRMFKPPAYLYIVNRETELNIEIDNLKISTDFEILTLND